VDATVVTDAPTLKPHKAKMCVAISRLLKVKPSDVSVKAKTTEGLPPGKQGIAAHAVVLLKRAQGSGLRVRGKDRMLAQSPQPSAHSQR
jgi:2-C-methyl-D-erythritol 2,4-cyclodiphosphate synthase